MIDRSQFLDELRRNPALMHRIAVIVAGEVGGGASPERQMIQAETIFNRAQARGQTLEQVMQEHRFKGDAGYYPTSTFNNGERIMGRGNAEARFKEQILKPVIAGSDKGTERLGFAPTGNASEGNTKFASSRAANGVYSKYKWLGDEMYVQEAKSGDRDERIAAARKGGPAPDVQLADAGVPQRQTPQEALVTRSLQHNYPGYQPPSYADVAGTNDQVPLPRGNPQRPAAEPAVATTTPPGPDPTMGAAPGQRASVPDTLASIATTTPAAAQAPAVAAAPTTTTTVSARARTPAATLGDRIIQAMGPRGAGRSTYIDPNTQHQILNPGGSGEEAMGITRDLGRVPAPPASPSRLPATARPTSQTGSSPAPAPEPYTRRTVPDILAPLQTTPETDPKFDENWMQRRNAFDRPELAPQRRAVPDVLAPLVNTPEPPPFDEFGMQRQNALDRPVGFGQQRRAVPDVLAPVVNKPEPMLQRRSVPDTLAPLQTSPERPPFDEFDMQRQNAAGRRPSLSPFLSPSQQFLQATNPAEADAAMARSRTDWSFPVAPEAARLLAAPPPQQVQAPTPQPQPQQTAGLFGAPRNQPGANWSPLEQWPPPWWNVGGGGYGGGGGGYGGGPDFGAFA
jgi:hypothetical protein